MAIFSRNSVNIKQILKIGGIYAIKAFFSKIAQFSNFPLVTLLGKL